MPLRSWLTGLLLLLSGQPALAGPVLGRIFLGNESVAPAEGIVHILEDNEENQALLGRFAQGINRSDVMRRRALAQQAGRNDNESRRQIDLWQTRLEGQLNRLVSLARTHAGLSTPISNGSFRAETPFERQLIVVVAQGADKLGWWIQQVTAEEAAVLRADNALHLRERGIPRPAQADDTIEEQAGN